MITDEIVEAIDALAELCGDEQQELGMKSVREMLCDFSETEWNSITKEESGLARRLSVLPTEKELRRKSAFQDIQKKYLKKSAKPIDIGGRYCKIS